MCDVIKISGWAVPCTGIDGAAFLLPAVFADYTDNWGHIVTQADTDTGAPFTPIIWTHRP